MPRRPPKWWFKKCVKSMTRKKVKKLHVRDAFKLCGYIWYHHTGAKRRAEILAIEKKRLAAAKRAAKRRVAKRRSILDRISSPVTSIKIKTIEYWIPVKDASGVVMTGEYFIDYKWKRIKTSAIQSVHGSTITTSSGSAYHLGKPGHPDAQRFLYEWTAGPSLRRSNGARSNYRIRSARSARSPESKLGLVRKRPRKTSVKICRKYDLVRRSKNGAESPEECFRRLSPKIGFGRAAAACSKDKATSHFIAAAMLPHGKMSVLATGSSEQMKALARSTSKAKRVTTVVYDNTGRSMATYSLYGSAMLPPARRKMTLEFWRPSTRRSTPEEECLTYARHYTNSWKEAFHICLAAKRLGVHPREILKEEKAPITPRAAEPARRPNRSRRR